MSERWSERARELREAFDRAFALPAAGVVEEVEPFLAIRLAGLPYAVALAELAGVHKDRIPTPIPGPATEHLGVAGVRGNLVSVYGLGALLGLEEPSRPWLLVAAGPRAVAFAVGEVEGTREVVPGEVVSMGPTGGGHGSAHLRGAFRDAGRLRPVIHLASVLEAVERRCAQARPRGESRSDG